MSKDKLIQIISSYESTREFYRAINKIDDIPAFKKYHNRLSESLSDILYENFNLPQLIICLYDLPQDNSENYFQFMGEVEYKEENFKGMICHDWLDDICFKWLSGKLTNEKLADELIGYIKDVKSHIKDLEKGNK